MLSGNSLRQTAHTHCASVHQASKLVAALLRVVGVTAGLRESNGSLPPGLWLMSPAGWLPRTGISSGTLRSAIEYGLPLPFFIPCHSAQTWRHAQNLQYVTCCNAATGHWAMSHSCKQHTYNLVKTIGVLHLICSWMDRHAHHNTMLGYQGWSNKYIS